MADAEAGVSPVDCPKCKGTGKKGLIFKCTACHGSGIVVDDMPQPDFGAGDPLAKIANNQAGNTKKADPTFTPKKQMDNPDAVSPFDDKTKDADGAREKKSPLSKQSSFKSNARTQAGLRNSVVIARRRVSLSLGLEDDSDGEMTPQKRLTQLAEEIQQFREVDETDKKYFSTEDAEPPWCDRISFDIAVCFLIISNIIVIAIETDALTQSNDRPLPWIVVEGVFCLLFILELAAKVRCHTCKWFTAHFLNFVRLIICLALFIDVMLDVIEAFTPVQTNGTWRLLSLARMLYLVQMKSRIPESWYWTKELRLVVKGLMDVMRTLIWVIILLGVFLYVCAVVMTTQVGQNSEVYSVYRKLSGGWDHEEYFGSVGKSMATLLRMMTLDGWFSKIGRHIATNQGYMMPFLLLFLFLSMYGVLNFIVAMIVEKTLESVQANQDKKKVREERSRRSELSSIREIFSIADTDNSGELDVDEFRECIRHPEVVWRMTKLELPIDDAMRLFAIMDGDGSRALTMQEFIDGCMKLKGVAMSKDMLKVQGQADNLCQKMDRLAFGIQDMEDSLETLDEITHRMALRFTSNVQETRARRAHKIGGSAPTKPQPKQRPGSNADGVPLSIGNRPDLPRFPDLLR